jgi:TolB-like protein/lipoprotein NlpI
MADVFISYARTDRQKIAKLAAAIEAQGLSVWWDRQILGGAEFAKDIELELQAAKVAVIAWSVQGNQSPWVRDEATFAYRHGKLVPISLDRSEAPLGFGQFQAIDFAGWSGNTGAPAFLELCRAIKARISGEAPSVSHAAKPIWWRALRPAPLIAASGLALAAIIAAFVLYPRVAETPNTSALITTEGKSKPVNVDPASIAVLAFVDLSADHDQQYFSDGIAEEILNVLARIEGLKVASRTSSFQFRNSQLGVPAIARDLGVRHVLEGSVRKAGKTIRITAQLIDANTDRHLWSTTYDRPLTAENVFAIQDEIANAIVGELAAKIGAGVNASEQVHVEADTDNVEAYELYLKGRALFAARGRDNLKLAARDLENAVALDPEFARAWEMVAMVYGVSDSWGITDRDYHRLALDAADRAERLNPDLAAPYAVRGTVTFDMIGTGESDDWKASITNFDEAIARDPKNATVWLWRGIDFLALGFFDRAVADFKHCRELDPAYGYCAIWLAYAHLVMGRDEDALRLYEGSKGTVFSATAAFAAAYARHGDNAAARAVLTDFYADVPEVASALYRSFTDPAFDDDDRTAALALIDKAPHDIDGITTARFFLGDYSDVVNNINAQIWWWRGDARYLKSAERKAHMRHFHLPDYWRAQKFPPQCRPVGVDDFECD